MTAARRLFFNVYHASFQHPPLAELGLTALVGGLAIGRAPGTPWREKTRTPPKGPGTGKQSHRRETQAGVRSDRARPQISFHRLNGHVEKPRDKKGGRLKESGAEK